MINLEVTVHSQILRHGGPASRFYYLMRALDVNGSGKATFNINDVKEFLGVKTRTLYNYTKKSNKLFINIIRRGDVWTVYYSSLIKVAANLDLNSLGACAKVLSQHLIPHRVLATEIVTEAQQQASEFMAVKSYKEKNKGSGKTKPNIIKPHEFFQLSIKSISGITAGITERKDGVLYVNEKFLPYGTTQAGVAKKFTTPPIADSTDGKERTLSSRTIGRHLRFKQKLRVAQSSPEYFYQRQFAEFQDAENWTNTSNRFFQKGLKVYKSLPSIYYPEYSLTSQKYQKNKLKNHLAKLSSTLPIAT